MLRTRRQRGNLSGLLSQFAVSTPYSRHITWLFIQRTICALDHNILYTPLRAAHNVAFMESCSYDMAGHSQFKNIMHRKGAQDKKRASLFAKLGRELTVAARSTGPDPDGNPRLRAAIAAARAANMPKDNLARAIKRGSGSDAAANYEEIRYEGYSKGGVAIIVETLTENRNRTASEVRSAFSRHGGTMAEAGAVTFVFEHVGEVRYAADAADNEAMFEAALDAGANDVQSDASGHEITCSTEEFHTVAGTLEDKFGQPQSAKFVWRPVTTTVVDEDAAESLFRLFDALDDNDDVQTISANYEIADDVLERLTA
jgi:YebC/PmpR family DNA-binding regulatory protein